MILSKKIMISALVAASAVALHTGAAAHSINAGDRADTPVRPFMSEAIAEFDRPWAVAFLPDGRMVITEKYGKIFLVNQAGQKTEVGNVPAVAADGQNGLLDIAVAPDFATDYRIYLTYTEPGEEGSRLVLARATLTSSSGGTTLADRAVIWRQAPAGGGGQPGGIIAFDPQGSHLFLAVGDRMQANSAQNPAQARGKVIRLNLDGSLPADNPNSAAGGIVAQTWTAGHRNPYGLAFAADGRLWLHEMGPRGGDEFNLIERGRNYGWPVVSNGDNYSGAPIPRHSTRPDFAAPTVYWTPVIAPAGLAFYQGALFSQWRGSALIGGLAAQSLVRLSFDQSGQPDEAERWNMGARIRDVAVAPDGAVWLLEDGSSAKLLRLTPRD
jgi:glucose/arabinose dehydrogenase